MDFVASFAGWLIFILVILLLIWGVKSLNTKEYEKDEELKEPRNDGYGNERHRHYVAHEETTLPHTRPRGRTLVAGAGAAASASSPKGFGERYRGTGAEKQKPTPRRPNREPEQRAVVTNDSSGTDLVTAVAVGALVGSLLSGRDEDSGVCSPGSSNEAFSGRGGSFDGGGARASYESSDSGGSSSSSNSSPSE